MARSLSLAVGVCFVAACGSSAASPARSASTVRAAIAACGPAAAHTLAGSSRARVYSLAGSVYGCATGGARPYRLGSATVCIGSARVGPVAVAGALAAYAVERCGIDTGTTVVEVRRLSDGRRLFSHVAVAAPGPESFDSVGSIVIDAGGDLAWIGHAGSIATHQSVTGVFAADRTGTRRLDRGTAIAVGSLRLTGSKLTWTHGGSGRSAKLG